MKRKLFVFLTVAIVLVSVAIPAFAVAQEVNIMDYATIEVDGLTKVVTITFPSEWLETSILDGGFGEKYSQTGNVSGFDLTSIDFSSGSLKVLFAPLGDGHNPYQQTNYNGRYLDVSELPNGSVLHYSVSAEMQAASGQSISFGSGNFNYATVSFEGNLSPLRDPKVIAVPTYIDGYFYSSEYDFVIEDNSKPFVFQHYFNISTNAPSSRWIFRLDEFTITTTVDALEQLEKNTGETNRLLEEVNKKLDDMTDYIPQPSDPSGGAGGELDSKTDEILTIIQENIEYMQNLILQWKSSIEDLASSFLAWADVLFFFINIPWVSILLITSVCFGCCATLFGVVAGLFKKE